MWTSLIQMKESFLSNDEKGWLAETSQGNSAVTASEKTIIAEEAKF